MVSTSGGNAVLCKADPHGKIPGSCPEISLNILGMCVSVIRELAEAGCRWVRLQHQDLIGWKKTPNLKEELNK